MKVAAAPETNATSVEPSKLATIDITAELNHNHQDEDMYNDASSADSDEHVECSALASLERDMPDFDYSEYVSELRELILAEAANNGNLFSAADVQTCKTNDWFLSRFLLRHKLDVQQAFEMLKSTLRFRNEAIEANVKPGDFPAEFYMLGALFVYERDRKNNVVVYIRGKVHRKMPELAMVVRSYVYALVSAADQQAEGKGIAICVDCTGAGLANADLDILFYLITTLKSYFPKGLSYILVHNLPFFLRPVWHIVKAWIPAEHRQLFKFSNSKTIFEYVDARNLPDFLGGTCTKSYKTPPDNCVTLYEAAKLWGIDKTIVYNNISKFDAVLPAEVIKSAVEQLLRAQPPDDETTDNELS